MQQLAAPQKGSIKSKACFNEYLEGYDSVVQSSTYMLFDVSLI